MWTARRRVTSKPPRGAGQRVREHGQSRSLVRAETTDATENGPGQDSDEEPHQLGAVRAETGAKKEPLTGPSLAADPDERRKRERMQCSTPHGGWPERSGRNAEALSGTEGASHGPPASSSFLVAPRAGSGGVGAAACPPARRRIAAALSVPETAPTSLILEPKLWSACQDSTYDEISEENGRKGVQGFPDRLQRYGRGHDRALQMAGFLDGVATDRRCQQSLRVARIARKLRGCGKHLVFRHYFTLDQVRLHEGMFCQKFKLCPLCALRRGAKMLRRYVERWQLVQAEHPQLRGYFITVTAKNQSDLGTMWLHVDSALRRWHQLRRESLCRGGPRPELAKALGSVGSYEAKRGKGSGLWHLHFHDAWLCAEVPDQDELRSEWRRLTGDSHVVDVRPFHHVRDGLPATAENVAADFCEVFKYAVKMQGLTLADNWQAAEDLDGRRLVRSRGLLYGVKVPDDLADDPLDDDDLPYVQLFYRYLDGAGYVLEHFNGDVPGDRAEALPN